MTSALEKPCRFCSEGQLTTIDSYKHRWVACEACGNIIREGKDSYLAERALPARVSSWLASTNTRYIRTFRRFFRDPHPETFYAYYQDALEQGVENTKYRAQFETLSATLARYGVTLEGRDVLDVSGGPGFLVKSISRIARRAVMTEYDPTIVEIARERLGIETVHYDFNEHDIGTLVEGQFDVVFIRYAINFCWDVPRFLASLRPHLRPGAHVFVTYVLPTMGTCLRWQLDDYAFHVLYNPETMTRMFAEAGLSLVATESDGSYDYRHGVHALARAIFPAYELKARLFSGVGPVMRQDNRMQLFTLPS